MSCNIDLLTITLLSNIVIRFVKRNGQSTFTKLPLHLHSSLVKKLRIPVLELYSTKDPQFIVSDVARLKIFFFSSLHSFN